MLQVVFVCSRCLLGCCDLFIMIALIVTVNHLLLEKLTLIIQWAE